MAIKVDELQHINKSTEIRMARHKMNDPFARYQQTTPQPVTYYHIDPVHSSTDTGFQDIVDRIGPHSPIRYTRIKDFPLYGIDPIVIQLEDGEQGLDGSYESEAIILHGTLRPTQDDYFIIPILDDPYLFKVTSIQYDSTMPDNYYRIGFKLDYIDQEMVDLLNKQVIRKDRSIFENIGTEKVTIIEEDKLKDINEVKEMVERMKSAYMALFYNERYNVFLAPMDKMHLKYLYDVNQTEFINKFSLFNEKMDFHTILLTQQVEDPMRNIKYAKSVYNFIENPDIDRMEIFEFAYSPGVTYRESAFYRWTDRTVMVTDILEHFPIDTMHIFSEEFVNTVKFNAETHDNYATLLKRYIRKEHLTIHDIPKNLDEELLYLNGSLEVFFLTPIIMYIIRGIVDKEMSKKEDI